MPGIIIVQEPGDDLWFQPDQCPAFPGQGLSAPERFTAYDEVYDPWPNLLDTGLSQVEPAQPGATTDAVVIADAPEAIQEQIAEKALFLSLNSKTGMSYNTRIAGYVERTRKGDKVRGGTCNPTAWCMKHCYAKVGHFVTWYEQSFATLSRQQRRYLANRMVTNWYRTAPESAVEEQADAVVAAARKKKLNNLRWNGGGDFDRGAVRIVNAITRNHPDFVIWGFTRVARWAKLLEPRHNLRVSVSMDSSTPPFGPNTYKAEDGSTWKPDNANKLAGAAAQIGHGLAFASSQHDDPALPEAENVAHKHGSRILTVFGYHCGPRKTEIGAPQECAATHPRVKGSCQVCQWCFMSDEERYSQGVRIPIESYIEHGGKPKALKSFTPMAYDEARMLGNEAHFHGWP